MKNCKVDSSAYEWIGHGRTESCGTPLLIGLGEEQWPSTTSAIERSERKLLEMKERGKFRNQNFVPDYQKLLICLRQ